jgi:hypothetical protein
MCHTSATLSQSALEAGGDYVLTEGRVGRP